MFSKPQKSAQTKKNFTSTGNGGDELKLGDPKLNLQKALKSGDVVYTPPTKIWIFTFRDGFYTYYPKKGETIGQIKEKFGIPNDVIKSLNAFRDDDCCPEELGKPVIFRYKVDK